MSHSFPRPIHEIVHGVSDQSWAQRFQDLHVKSVEDGNNPSIATEIAKQFATSRMLDDIHAMLMHLCRQGDAFRVNEPHRIVRGVFPYPSLPPEPPKDAA